MKNNKHEKSLSPRSVFHLCLRHFTLAILATIVLSGCGSGSGSGGGGGGGGGSPASGVNVLSGTAATGAPIASGTVTLKDSAGVTATTTTDANGNYSFDVGAKRFPLMLKVETNIAGTTPLFSAALTSGTANVTPLTNLQIFEASDRTDPAVTYSSGDLSKLTISSLDKGKTIISSNYSEQILVNGLDPTTIDFITKPFVANGQGMDAMLDNISIAIIGSDSIAFDSKGNCVSYGLNIGGLTLGIDGMAPEYISAFFGVDSPFLFSSTDLFENYVESALDRVCVVGTPVPDGSAVMSGHSESYYRVTWLRNPTLGNTRVAADKLKASLKLAMGKKRLPINVVAHSWGSVIAYIALTELSNSQDPAENTIKVANLITMGSPIQCLAGGCIKSDLIQQSVPSDPLDFRGQPIQVPRNVTTWTNFVNAGDSIASNIVVPENVKNVKNEPVKDCPAPPSSGMAGTTPTLALCKSHSVYFNVGDAFTVAPTLFRIRSLIAASSAEQIPAPTTAISPPLSTTPALPPLAFSLTAGTPYCDTNTSVGPAVKLTWNVSDGAVYYRAFRNDSAIGVQLNASQLSFLNNLGLVDGQTYSYKVQAINANGTTWSDTVQVAIPTAVCGSVTSPKITVGPASLSFGNVSVGTCGTATFVIQHVSGTNPASGTVSIGPNPPFGVLSGGSFSVSNGSAANVDVRFCPSSSLAYTGTATVTSSATFTGVNSVTLSGMGTTTITLPAAPSALTANTLSQSNIALTWQDNSDNETGFKIERKTGTSGTFAQIATVGPISGVGSGGYYENTGLTAATTYCYRTRAYNTAGDSSYTSESCATTQQAPVITPPTATTSPATNVTSNSATLNGTVNPNGTASGAFFQWGTTTSYGNLTPNDTTPGSGTTAQPVFANLTGLSPNTTHHFRIVAVNGSGGTVFGADQSFTTASTPSTTPTVSSVSPSTITLGTSYQSVTITGTGFTSSSYHQYSVSGGSTWAWATSAPTINGSTSMTIGVNNTVAQTIYFRVCASYGSSACSGIVAVTVQAAASATPTAPSGLVAGAASSFMSLAWNDNSSNETGFNVERKTGISGSWSQIAGVGQNIAAYRDYGVSAGVTYYYRVYAYNASGNSGYSNEASATIAGSAKVVTVANTGGIGLNLRSTASTSGAVIAALPEGTTMSVIGGPALADGFTWWNISGTYGTGWSAIAEWLTPAPQIGATVTVSYTGGAGLRLRSTASLSGTILTTLPEGTQVNVFSGPIQANGYTWWAVQGYVSGTQYTGWSAVGDWLTPNPRY